MRAGEKCIRRSKQNIKWFASIYVIFIKVFATIYSFETHFAEQRTLEANATKRSKTDGVIEREQKITDKGHFSLCNFVYVCVRIYLTFGNKKQAIFPQLDRQIAMRRLKCKENQTKPNPNVCSKSRVENS